MLTAQRKIAVLSVLDLHNRIKSTYGPQTKLQPRTMLEMGLRTESAHESRACPLRWSRYASEKVIVIFFL